MSLRERVYMTSRPFFGLPVTVAVNAGSAWPLILLLSAAVTVTGAFSIVNVFCTVPE